MSETWAQWEEKMIRRESRLESSRVVRTSTTEHFNLNTEGRRGEWSILNSANEVINVLEYPWNADILNSLYNQWMANDGSMMMAQMYIPKDLLARFDADLTNAMNNHSGASWAFVLKAAINRIMNYVDILNYATLAGHKFYTKYIQDMAIAEDRYRQHQRKLAERARQSLRAG